MLGLNVRYVLIYKDLVHVISRIGCKWALEYLSVGYGISARSEALIHDGNWCVATCDSEKADASYRF